MRWAGRARPAIAASLWCAVALAGAGCSEPAATDGSTNDVEAAIRGYFTALMTQNARALDTTVTAEFALIDNGHRIERDRFTETWVEGQPLDTRFRLQAVQVEAYGAVALAELIAQWFQESVLVQVAAHHFTLRREGDRWRVHRVFSSSLPVGQPADSLALDDYVGTYRIQNYVVEVERRGDRLITYRPGGSKWVGGLREAALLPGGGDAFYMEMTNSPIEFVRDADGAVTRLLLYEPFSTRGFPLEKAR